MDNQEIILDIGNFTIFSPLILFSYLHMTCEKDELPNQKVKNLEKRSQFWEKLWMEGCDCGKVKKNRKYKHGHWRYDYFRFYKKKKWFKPKKKVVNEEKMVVYRSFYVSILFFEGNLYLATSYSQKL